MNPQRGRYLAIFILFLFSGASGLVYEVVWLRQLVLIFGSTQFATSTILSTFMAGLALGAYLAGRWFNRAPWAPLRVYGLLEIAIGLYALAVPTLFKALSPIYRQVWDAGGADSLVAFSLAKFAGIALVLLPPTVLMGASLPVLARQIADDPERIGGKVGGLYAINIFGAVAGVACAGFLLVPGLGVRRTILITALLNVVVGTIAIALAGRAAYRGAAQPRGEAAEVAAPASGRIRLALVIFGLSGFGALVLEVAWTRVLSLVFGSSVYAFSLMLLAFLTGLAIGGAYFSAFLRRRPDSDPARLLAGLLIASGVLAYASGLVFQKLPGLFAWIFVHLNPDPNGWFIVQFGIGLVVMFPATFALGGIFPAVLQIHARSLARVAGSVGTVYASNTVGTIAGAALAGFLLIPTFGMLMTVVLVAEVQLVLGLLAATLMVCRTARGRLLVAVPVLIAAALMWGLRPEWNALLMNAGPFNLYGQEIDPEWGGYGDELEGVEVVYAAEGLTGSVFVADEPEFDNRYLSVNGKVEASSQSDLETQLLAAHLPLLFHDQPDDVLVIGLASGISVGAVATHPVKSIRVLEIEKKMLRAAELFAEYNGNVLEDDRLSISYNDARNELEFSQRTYDVIVSEPSNPWMTVAANLFTEDFFRMARTRLNENGIFCQWVQSYYLSTEDMRSIIAAFHDSFPHVLLFEVYDGVDLLLLGSQSPLGIDLEELAERMSELRVGMDLGRAEIRTPIDLLSSFRMGPRDVARLVLDAPRNSDDNARVEFSAPKALGLYTVDNNSTMVRQFRADPAAYLDPPLVDPAKIDAFRLGLAVVWARRGDFALAEEAAGRVREGPLRAQAEQLLLELNQHLGRPAAPEPAAGP